MDIEDKPFVHFSAKQKAVAWISKSFFDRVSYTARKGIAKGCRRRGGLGWLPELSVTPEVAFLRSLDFSGMLVYDVGAFHGMMTMFFARRARQVVAFEPNSVNRRRIMDNIALNGFQNVLIRPIGLGSVAGMHRMVWDSLMPGAAAISGGQGAESEQVLVSTLDQEKGLPPDFIKIDTEGFESAVLRGGKETLTRRPRIFLELHGDTMRFKHQNAEEIVGLLADAGYQRILHVESGNTVTHTNSAFAAQGHLYATA